MEKLQPYIETVNTRFYAPVSAVGYAAYDKFAAPRVAQARSYGEKEWQRVVRPRLDDLNNQAQAQYEARLAPYVDCGYSAVTPYLEGARNIASHQYQNVLVPTYYKSLPYAQYAYSRTQQFVIKYGIPYTRSAYATSTTFVLRKVWPPIRVLYGRNVEPQLSKIKERLASYRDSKKIEAALSDMDESQISQTTAVSSTGAAWATLTDNLPGVSSSSTASSAMISSSTVSEPINVTEELKRWQTKFARASDQGAEDLARRVADVASNHKSHHIEGLGAALVTELEDVSSSAQSDLKSAILSSVQGLPGDASDADQSDAYDALRTHIRTQGNKIKDKAQELRLWKLNSNNELTNLLSESSSSTLSVLDGIRDLGLQEIGMRWASSDHITYEDWTQYHKLKQSFHDWRETVVAVVTNHAGVAAARTQAEDLEDTGMSIASNSAAELARLKDVARWKIHAQDSSDDFTSRKLPAAAARLGQKIMSKASAVTGIPSSQNMAESIISAATSSAESAASEVSWSLSLGRDSASSAASNSASSLAAAVTGSSSGIADTIDSSSPSLLDAISSVASSLFSAPINPSPSPSASALSEQIASSLSSAALAAASNAASITSAVGASSGSFSKQATIAAGSAASKASVRASLIAADAGIIDDPASSGYLSAASKSVTSVAADTVDGASSASEAIRSLYESVGTDFTVVTHSVLERASVIAEEASASATEVREGVVISE